MKICLPYGREHCFHCGTPPPKSHKIDPKWTPKLTQNHTTLPLDTTLKSPCAPLTPIVRKSSKMTSKRVPKMTSKSTQKRHRSEPATPWAPDGCPRWLQTLQNLDFGLQNLDFRPFFGSKTEILDPFFVIFCHGFWIILDTSPWCHMVRGFRCSQLGSACNPTACALMCDAWCVVSWCPGVW